MKPFDEIDPTPERPMYDPASIPGQVPYRKRDIDDLNANPAVVEFLAKNLDELLRDHRVSHEVVAKGNGHTFHQHVADCILARLSLEFPGVRGLLLGEDERIQPDVGKLPLGIGPDIGPIPPGLQVPVIGLAIAASHMHGLLLDIFENTSAHGIDARAAMLGPGQEQLELSEKVLEGWRHHLGLDVFEAVQSIDD
ncbi:hypothetical protein [Singulisphaera sp. PoT]|uniref:hypothetical protein n=1 Tax=Singulisphaera sp. PoT TaxID=3411797 RepID=UPI003BF54C9F